MKQQTNGNTSKALIRSLNRRQFALRDWVLSFCSGAGAEGAFWPSGIPIRMANRQS